MVRVIDTFRTPEELRWYMRNSESTEEVPPKMRGALVGHLNKGLGGDENRRMVLGWLFGGVGEEISTKELTEREWRAIRDWVNPIQIEDKLWEPSPHFDAECNLLLERIEYDRRERQNRED